MSAVIDVRHLSKAFGGVHAIEDLSFDLGPSTVLAIVGPNGAGKTTLINLLTGNYLPDAGTIDLFGVRVNARPPEQFARLGLSRTFQNLQVCMNMSALDNVLIGAHLKMNDGLLAGILQTAALREREAHWRARARQLLDFVGLGPLADAMAAQLSYGSLKRLEIARSLIGEPRLVLMDEPAAGLNPSEKGEIARLIQSIAERGVSIVLVEHDMKLVMGVSQRLLVLNHGRRLALGATNEVRKDPAVIEAYLGAAA
ncbi:MAG: ABC transporter ATP-binding protein [Burkholderiales bacterium]|nr:ABC transporter ATP-binding protein [Burkholderiales bacterium]